MGTILFITFVVVPILEIALFMEIGDRIGLGATISIIILTAIIGTFLIRHQGIATLKKAQHSLQTNRLPIDEAFDGLCIIFAGALLLTPGFFTDSLGLSLFMPPLRNLLKRFISKFFPRSKNFNYRTRSNSNGTKETSGSLIDGEFEDITKDCPEKAVKRTPLSLKSRPKIE